MEDIEAYNMYTHNRTNDDDDFFVTEPEFYFTVSGLFICFILYSLVQRYRQLPDVGLSERLCNRNEVKKQPIIYNETSSPRSCSICLDDFSEGMSLVQLECGHMYHLKCIDDWLIRQSSCPLCRCEFI